MSESAQIILAVGVAGFLVMSGSVGVIWSLRCRAGSERYRFPPLLGISMPLLITGYVVLQKLL